MTKADVKRILPYNTIAKCEKAYHEEMKKVFDFEGINMQQIEIIEACIYNIYTSIRNDSQAQLEKFFAGKENRRKSFEAFKNGDYGKIYELLFSQKI